MHQRSLKNAVWPVTDGGTLEGGGSLTRADPVPAPNPPPASASLCHAAACFTTPPFLLCHLTSGPRRGVPPKQSVSGGTVRLKSGGDSDDGATTGVSWTPRPERLTAVVHKRAEMGRAECECSKSAYCCLPFSRPSPPVLARCSRCLGEAVVRRRRAQTPDNGGAQAGGVFPPFTVCARSWFEVWGERVGEREGRWVGGSERVE